MVLGGGGTPTRHLPARSISVQSSVETPNPFLRWVLRCIKVLPDQASLGTCYLHCILSTSSGANYNQTGRDSILTNKSSTRLVDVSAIPDTNLLVASTETPPGQPVRFGFRCCFIHLWRSFRHSTWFTKSVKGNQGSSHEYLSSQLLQITKCAAMSICGSMVVSCNVRSGHRKALDTYLGCER